MEFTDDEDDHLEEEEEDDDDEGITIPTPNPTTAPTPIRNGAGAAAGGSHTTATRYRECQKNHAVSIGGHAVDGCGEFMPAGEEGSLDALKCAACGCHRNFHRKESDISTSPDLGAGPASSSGAALHHPHQLFPPPYYHRTPVPPPQQQHGYGLHHHHMQQHYSPHHQRPLALPSSSGGRTEEMEELSNPSSSGGGRSGSRSKRFRTKFTAEQKERMAEFAERIGWRIQKQDEAAVQQFCQEVNVTRQVLKVWLHNNKHSLARKP